MITLKNQENHLKLCKMCFTVFGRASPQLETSNPQLYWNHLKNKKTLKKCVFCVHCICGCYWSVHILFHTNSKNVKTNLKMCKKRFTAFGRAGP